MLPCSRTVPRFRAERGVLLALFINCAEISGVEIHRGFTMKAIVVHEFGGPEVLRLEEIPPPRPGAGQVRVRVRAAGGNPYDTYMRNAVYAIKPPLPYTPGSDGAGDIEAVGESVTKL